MSRPRFFSVPADIADTLVPRQLRQSWVDVQGAVRVLLSSADLFAYGIGKALENGAVEMTSTQVAEIISNIKDKS